MNVELVVDPPAVGDRCVLSDTELFSDFVISSPREISMQTLVVGQPEFLQCARSGHWRIVRAQKLDLLFAKSIIILWQARFRSIGVGLVYQKLHMHRRLTSCLCCLLQIVPIGLGSLPFASLEPCQLNAFLQAIVRTHLRAQCHRQ